VGVHASSRARAERPAWLPLNGEVIDSRYRVDAVLGAGGMGAVVAGVDLKLAQNVAIKFLNPEHAHKAEQVGRFVREAQATSRVRTEHAVRVLDVGSTAGGLHYIVMERLEGADLGDHVARGPLPIQLAVDCILQAAEALSEAHAAGIVHRDIKPSNLWLSRRSDGTPLLKVLDFGISKLAPAADTSDPKLTETQAVFGSPTYMSPEQIRSAKNVDSSTDVWALGVVLHELLTGHIPFEGDSVSAVLASVSADPPAPLLTLRPDAPPELASVILACLEKDRSRRISLKDLARRLRPHASLVGAISADRIMSTAGPTASLLPPPTPSSRPVTLGQTDAGLATTRLAPTTAAQRTRRVAGAAVLLSVGAVVGALALLWLRHEPDRTATPRVAASADNAPPPPVTAEPSAPPSSVPIVVPPAAVASATGSPSSVVAAPAPSSRKVRAAVAGGATAPVAAAPATARPSATATANVAPPSSTSMTRE